VLAAVAVALLVILAIWWLATRPPTDMPAAAGRYPIRSGSIVYDGAAYGFLWAGRDGAFTRARSSAVRLVLDETTFLEVAPAAPPELHVAQDEAIRTERPTATARPPVILRRDDGRDDPADDVDREIRPAPTRRALTPSATPGLAPVDDGVSGQNRGAGGGNAVTNRIGSPSLATGVAGPTSTAEAPVRSAASGTATRTATAARTAEATTPTRTAAATTPTRPPSISTGGSRPPAPTATPR
jgi:hypothetical protein